MAMAVHNNVQNGLTKQVPNEVLIGFLPTLAPASIQNLGVLAADNHATWMAQTREMAIDVINQPTVTLRELFTIGDQVWLEGKILPISVGSTKLCPKCYGPFKISRVISPVAYQL